MVGAIELGVGERSRPLGQAPGTLGGPYHGLARCEVVIPDVALPILLHRPATVASHARVRVAPRIVRIYTLSLSLRTRLRLSWYSP